MKLENVTHFESCNDALVTSAKKKLSQHQAEGEKKQNWNRFLENGSAGEVTQSPKKQGQTDKDCSCRNKIVYFWIFIHFLTPRHYNWNILFRWNSNSIHRAIHTAQMTDLAIFRILYYCFLCFGIEPDYVCRTWFYTSFTSNASIYTFNWHLNFSYYSLLLMTIKREITCGETNERR